MQCKDDVNLLRENETGITIRFQSLFISLSLEYIYPWQNDKTATCVLQKQFIDLVPFNKKD